MLFRRNKFVGVFFLLESSFGLDVHVGLKMRIQEMSKILETETYIKLGET